MSSNEPQKTSRRAFLRNAGIGAAALMTAACGTGGGSPASAPASSAAASTPAAPASSAAASGSSAAAPAVNRLGPAQLKLALFGNQEAAANLTKLLEGFSAEQPDITVQVTPYEAPDWNGFFQKLLTEVAAGQTPDLVSVATEGAHLFAGRGLAAPVTEYVMRDKEQLREYFGDVSPSLIEAMMYDGQLYSLPDNFNAANLYYSKTAFDNAGVAYPTNWTKDDFYNNMPKLTGGNAAENQFGYFWTNRMWGGAVPWIFLNGGNVLTEERFAGGEALWNEFYPDDAAAQGRGGGYRWNQATANLPQNVEALQLLVDLTHNLKVSPGPAQADSAASQIRTLFANGQLATFPSGGYLVRGLSNDQVDPNTYSVTLMPRWQTQRHQYGTAGLFIMEQSQNKDAAWELAKFRIKKPTMEAQFQYGSSVPTRRSLSSLFETVYGFKDYQIFYGTLDKAPDTAPIPQPPQANEITASFTKNIGLAMTQELTPQAAMDQMQREFEEVLKRQA
jgi:ABC-type glycerol-3-phosphate transport system substrate-binding protein